MEENKYIDLGLPSGTLWMESILEDGDKYRFTKKEIEENKNITLPTKEQVKELFDNCKWSLGTYLHKQVSDYGPYLLDGGIYETIEDEINKTLNFAELNLLSIDSGTGYFLGYGRKDGNFLIKGVKNK